MILIPAIRLATPDDARGIAEMSREDIEHGLGWSWTQERVTRAIHERSTNVAVIDEPDRLLGFGIMQYGERKAHLALLGVQAVDRRRGIGTLLLSWLEECAIVAGIERIELEARVDNGVALAFYRRQGYRQKGTVPGYYRSVLDAVRLEKRLVADAGETGDPGR